MKSARMKTGQCDGCKSLSIEVLQDTDRRHYCGKCWDAFESENGKVLTDAQRQLNVPVSGVITGGDAPVLLPLMRTTVRHEPYLVLDGLAVFAGSTS